MMIPNKPAFNVIPLLDRILKLAYEYKVRHGVPPKEVQIPASLWRECNEFKTALGLRIFYGPRKLYVQG
jgi:hypothetical protein